MSDVQFQEEVTYSRNTSTKAKAGIPDMLISWGVAKDKNSANQILLVVTIVCAVLFLIFLGYDLSTANGHAQNPDEAARIRAATPLAPH